MQLASNTVLITGGASGIGLALARRFIQEGSTVIICGRREEKLAEARRNHPGLETLVCDLSKEKERTRVCGWATKEFPRLNVLVNNAGIQRRAAIGQDKKWSATHEEIAINLEAPVHLLGRVPDVAAWLQRADVLVHPARWEGFGLALLEAMLASKPVVATSVSSIPEIVVDGQTGLLVPPDEPQVLAAAVTRVLDEPGDYGEQGRRRAQSQFSVSRMADRTLALYETALRRT